MTGSSSLTSTGSTRRWRRIRAWVLVRDEHSCQLPGTAAPLPASWAALHAPASWPGVCGAYADHVDHVEHRAGAGSDSPANLRAACAWHNLHRGTRTDAELLAELGAPSATPRHNQRPAGRWTW